MGFVQLASSFLLLWHRSHLTSCHNSFQTPPNNSQFATLQRWERSAAHLSLLCFHYKTKVLKFCYAPQWQSWIEKGLSERRGFRPYKCHIATCSMTAAAPYLQYWRGVWIHYSAANLPLNSEPGLTLGECLRWEASSLCCMTDTEPQHC